MLNVFVIALSYFQLFIGQATTLNVYSSSQTNNSNLFAYFKHVFPFQLLSFATFSIHHEQFIDFLHPSVTITFLPQRLLQSSNPH